MTDNQAMLELGTMFWERYKRDCCSIVLCDLIERGQGGGSAFREVEDLEYEHDCLSNAAFMRLADAGYNAYRRSDGVCVLERLPSSELVGTCILEM